MANKKKQEEVKQESAPQKQQEAASEKKTATKKKSEETKDEKTESQKSEAKKTEKPAQDKKEQQAEKTPREPQGFKVVNGDMQEWEKQMKIRYDNEHEGFMGYVQTDENRWEYQKVVNKLSTKEDISDKEKKEEKKSSGLKL